MQNEKLINLAARRMFEELIPERDRESQWDQMSMELQERYIKAVKVVCYTVTSSLPIIESIDPKIQHFLDEGNLAAIDTALEVYSKSLCWNKEYINIIISNLKQQREEIIHRLNRS